ncbi:uncharacterized protein GGS22DRAFT_198916 [Annulohypoxylon maeteangense]|uniref:uncharacterized protein n=1 Tax=Annulohypoxylon maeteangense TaxID=1927788 RepID=UPI0020082D0C|nr:uncharacterized protein GGS22DRAFT_198916 [Annulohypoxylon maeteangense]KAI0886494.1 hypothetical protein GGS22DRAFT_198916 [Annulohypoxylon maeteangense]
MCHRRRVFYACLHEDTDVTPPRSILYCGHAVPSQGSSANTNVRPCMPASLLPLTDRTDFFASIIRPVPCEICATNTSHISLQSQPLTSPTLPIERMVPGDTPGRETSNSRGSNVNFSYHLSALDRIMGRQEQSVEEFDFSWYENKHHDTDSANLGKPSISTTNDKPYGIFGPSDISFRSNKETDSIEETPSATELQDFQLYDGENEFADELEEVRCVKEKEPSSK